MDGWLFGWSMGSREESFLGRLYVLLISLIEVVSYNIMGFCFSFQRKCQDHVVSLDVPVEIEGRMGAG